jgi:citrate transporter, citMHS family
MVGIFEGTGMLTAMAQALMSIIPAPLGRYIHVIFGILALPLGLCVGTDAYFYGIMPLVMKVGETYGVASLSTALTMIIGKNLALMVSPLVPATYLAIGLTNTELKDHMKFSIPPYFVISMFMLILGIVFGIIPL